MRLLEMMKFFGAIMPYSSGNGSIYVTGNTCLHAIEWIKVLKIFMIS